MDSAEKVITLREFAQQVVHRSYIAVRNEVRVDPTSLGRGVLKMQHAELKVFRFGEAWLVRWADVAAIINPTTGSTQQEPPAPARRPGRPRLAAKQIGGEK